MKPIILFLAALLVFGNTYAQKPEQYSRAKIYLDATDHNINGLATTGIAVDHGDYKKNTYFISDFSASEIDRVKKAGFKVDIIIADVSQYYRDQNKKKAEKITASVSCDEPMLPTPSHFHLGSYGGFFTYTEMLAILDSMQILYPGLISVRQPIGTSLTIEGRPIYWIRVSNNPAVDNPAKPEMLYTALHHAREPGSISSMIYYLWYLLENYSTNDHVKKIIDNTELYFVPCINPDGYLYNIASSPGGGGMWRKNRRDNLDGTYGVDLNRNYGYLWGYDDFGSSPNTYSDTYRGTAGFSEPETQAIKWFSEHHDFKICLNYHTYQNDVLYPWGHVPSLLTVDSQRFFNYGQFLTKHNDYRFGTCYEVLGYVSNGASDDWMYGDVSGKPKIFAMTPEIGAKSYGFYPPASEIIPDCENNLLANLNAASLLLPFCMIEHTDKKIITQPSGYLHYKLQRLGFPDTAAFTATIIPLDSWLTVPATPKVYSSLAISQEIDDSISYTLSATTPNGQLVKYALKLNNGFYDTYDTVSFYYGKYYIDKNPSTASLTDWINAGWGLSSTYYSAPYSIQSSLSGHDDYLDNDDITISTAAPMDLTKASQAYLYFYTKWRIETGNDFAYVNASINGTGTWSHLCGKYTRTDPYSGDQVYDGMQEQWIREEIDLHDYIGKKINIQFELYSDAGVTYKGFYFDDVNIVAVVDSSLSVPEAAAPGTLHMYPNPASEEINIVSGGGAAMPFEAAMYDCLGREAMRFIIDKPSVKLDVARMPAGMYYLKTFEKGKPSQVQKVNIVK